MEFIYSTPRCPTRLQEGSQRVPRWSKVVPRGCKVVPTALQASPEMVQAGPKWPQVGPKWCQEGSKMPQDCPMMAPGWSNLAQNGRKMAPGAVGCPGCPWAVSGLPGDNYPDVPTLRYAMGMVDSAEVCFSFAPSEICSPTSPFTPIKNQILKSPW